MTSLITIALPVYKRLNYLPQVLRAIAAQHHEAIDLLVSDNGQNGDELRQLVEQYYPRPFRMRQNPQTVSISAHFNQLIAAAQGEYFVLLADDDEINPAFAATLAGCLDGNPAIAVALPRVATMDIDGNALPDANMPLPPRLMDWRAFVRSWANNDHHYVSFATHVSRTAEVRAAGGYPEFPSGNYNDNALLVKLIVGRSVAYAPEALFRYRIYETSTGLAASAATLASASRMFLAFLDHDPDLVRFAAAHPQAWRAARAQLGHVTWMTYFARWRTIYRSRMTNSEWVRAAFAFPWTPAYYRKVLGTLAYSWGPLAALLSLRRRLAAQL